MRASEIRELLKLLDLPGIVSFAGGIPDPALFPIAEAKAAYGDVLGEAGAGPGGAAVFGQRGLPAAAAVDRAAHGPARRAVRRGQHRHHVRLAAGAGIPWPPVALARRYGAGDRADLPRRPAGLLRLSSRATTSCAPTTATARRPPTPTRRRLPAAGSSSPTSSPTSPIRPARPCRRPARERLLDLATELDIPVIEDSAYSALRFEGEAIPAIQALDVARSGGIDAARTIYCGTFSKTMSPGLRVGWIVAGKPLIRRLVLVKQASDLNSANVNQMVMHKLVETAYERQVTAARGALSPPPRRHAGGARRAHAGRHDLDRAARRAVRVGAPAGRLRRRGIARAGGARRRAWRSCRAAHSSSTAAGATPSARAIRCPTRPRSAMASGGWQP